MAKLTTRGRQRLAESAFAGPDRSYPINDAAHARDALARAAQHASPELQAHIKAKVRKRYPNIAVEGEKSSPRHGRRSRSR